MTTARTAQPKMRAYGSGSKRERAPGVWELRVAGRSRTFRGSSKEAEKALAAMIGEVSLRPPEAGTTLGELLDRWFPVAPVTASTLVTYRHASKQLPESAQRWKISAITPRHFMILYRELGAKGVSVHTIHKLHTVMLSSLRSAVEWGWLDTNPAHGVRLPRIPKRKDTTPSDEAVRWLLTAAEDSGLQTEAWIRFALAMGGRRGEQLALRWSDVNLDTGKVEIYKAIIDEDGTEGPTKTEDERTLYLDADTLTYMRRWRDAQLERAEAVGVKLARDPYVFSEAVDSSTSWRPDGATQRFRRLRERAGVPRTIRLHDLRHAHANMLLHAGVAPTLVAKRMGHSVRTLSATYANAIDEGAARELGAVTGRLLRAVNE